MHIVSVISQKGGAGKTTLAVNLAVAAQQGGKEVAVIDLDPQASAASWGDARQGEPPSVVSAQPARLPLVIEVAEKAGAELILIDTAPHSESVALAAARAADLVLIPCRPAIFDLRSIQSTLTLAELAKKRAAVVLNAVPPQGSIGTEAERALKGLHAEVVPAQMTQRVAYMYSLTNAQGVCEYEPSGKASREVSRLLRWLLAALGEKGTK
jgi:chromosome partitioning protein